MFTQYYIFTLDIFQDISNYISSGVVIDRSNYGFQIFQDTNYG